MLIVALRTNTQPLATFNAYALICDACYSVAYQHESDLQSISYMKKSCAYCGESNSGLTKDHVIPRSLYPSSKGHSRVQRLTVPACNTAITVGLMMRHTFRNVLTIAGEANDVVRELWNAKVTRSFREVDGRRRFGELLEQMQTVETASGGRHKIFPANDDRFLRILRKIVRGLHYHELSRQIAEEVVVVDILRWTIPQEFIEAMPILHRESDVFEYQFEVFDAFDDISMSSAWLLRFFETRRFIGIVWKPNSVRMTMR